jgi:hypothetical protein
MRTSGISLGLLLSAALTCAAEPDQTFTSHTAFYSHVAQKEGLRLPWRRLAIPQATPTTRELSVTDLDKSWGRMQLRSDSIVISGRPLRWVDVPRPMGRPRPIELDLEFVQLWESPAAASGHAALCLQSPAGSSGGASRWRHVVLIDRPSGKTRPATYAWTAPYASCEALWTREGVGWIAGVFEFSFESEQAASKAGFVLHSLQQRSDLAHYVLTLADPGDLFTFRATRSTVP